MHSSQPIAIDSPAMAMAAASSRRALSPTKPSATTPTSA